MNFTEYTFFRIRVFKLLEKFTDRPCPHVHIVLQNRKFSFAKFGMHRNWVLYFLPTIDYLLPEYTKPARSFYPLICVAFDFLDWTARNMFGFRVGRGERARWRCRGAWRAQGRTLSVCFLAFRATRCHSLGIRLCHSTSCHIESFCEFASCLGSCCIRFCGITRLLLIWVRF